MGTNGGSGVGGGVQETGGMMGGNANQPATTEYTLQGVMRFLQTEWHRHERDRNAWEIERQEMKSRIASLEGQARRADATQKALKKYVAILEKKVKEQAALLKSDGKADAATRPDRAALLQEKLRPSLEKPNGAAIEAGALEAGLADEEASRNELKAFLDQCQAEFTYLMITPANPMPRESHHLCPDYGNNNSSSSSIRNSIRLRRSSSSRHRRRPNNSKITSETILPRNPDLLRL
ncbi:4831b53f-9186-4d46-84aa-7123ae787179 [Thermothielavioides terrestris]|uniref:4831b53f-9186-4d46-84aa-7123ae787179 n=1 Tax=Thermothielavioides terrestris TaxID=2587410 RepID=A0A3S5CWE3_9PEZI|nr:4831b53f-9186-4d46-84aa-7123ae787179 [Thermothielavioides terrestris]